MVQLQEIGIEQLRPLIAVAFSGDHALLENYHISPGTLDHCADNTFGMILENADFYKGDMQLFRIDKDNAAIGYTVVIKNEKLPNELYSFGINIAHRNRETLKKWLSEVEKILAKQYYIVLWSKNTRAIDFFAKNKFSVLRNSKYLNDETKTLLICQPED